jgi:hypothetical protein
MLEAAKPARKAVKAKRPPAKRAAGRAAAAGRAPARVKRQLPR